MEMTHLQNNKGFTWHSKGGISVKGFLFDNQDNFFPGKEIIEYFSSIDSFSDFEERVNYANGAFSVIIHFEEEIFVATDIIRTFPLFYARHQGKWILSDDAGYLSELTGNHEINPLAKVEFLAAGYVTGNETLLQGIRQVQAGEIIRFKEDDLNNRFYYSYRTHKAREDEYEDLKSEGLKTIQEAFARFIVSLDNKTVVLPLSGGYDSRLIAAKLKHFGYKDVVCFTYGRKSSPEIEISEKVAKQLGYKWIFVEYTEELIEGYLEDEHFRQYYPYASQYVSMFYMQEYFAVRYLKENKLIPDDSVFVPGHSGDFLAGSQLNKHSNLRMEESLSQIAERIYSIKYCFNKPNPDNKPKILDRIEKSLQEKFIKDSDLAYTIHEDWDFKEKLAKFNFNSATTYAAFGYEYRFPFWDRYLVDFFKRLPLHAKINKYLYDDILCNDIFENLGLNFDEELTLTDNALRFFKIKKQIKQILPEAINRIFITKDDPLFYREITEMMQADAEKEGEKISIHGNSYNSVILQWYIWRMNTKDEHLNK